MVKTSQECLDFLGKAREAMDDLSVVQDRETQLVQDEKRLGKALETERKVVSETISQTLKKRRDEINITYDKEINKVQEQLKKARSKREKAKSQGVKERIAGETAELYSLNREIKALMKSLFKEKRVPGFCNSALYYSLFLPKWPKELMTALLYVLVFFAAIPCGIYYLIPERTHMHLTIIYLLDILIFGGIYISISNRTKMHHMETLRVGRKYMDDIRANNIKIKKVTSSIKKDSDEGQYHLEKFDDEIAQFQQDLNEVTAKKKEALNYFESVTRTILQDEIEHNHKARIDQLQADYSEVQEQLKATSAEVKTKRLNITDNYATHLGKEYLDPLKIAELCTIVQSGQAANVSEAIAVHKAKKDQAKA